MLMRLMKHYFYAVIGLVAIVCPLSSLADMTINNVANSANAPVAESANINAQGKIIDVNKEDHELTIHHSAISALNWPDMTMSFLVDKAVNISHLKAGDTIQFTLQKNPKGDMVITKIIHANS